MTVKKFCVKLKGTGLGNNRWICSTWRRPVTPVLASADWPRRLRRRRGCSQFDEDPIMVERRTLEAVANLINILRS